MSRVAYRVDVNPRRMSGQPCISGTRITTATMRALRDERGLSVEKIVALYPGLTVGDVLAALAFEDSR